jgi:hypothetical protein
VLLQRQEVFPNRQSTGEESLVTASVESNAGGEFEYYDGSSDSGEEGGEAGEGEGQGEDEGGEDAPVQPLALLDGVEGSVLMGSAAGDSLLQDSVLEGGSTLFGGTSIGDGSVIEGSALAVAGDPAGDPDQEQEALTALDQAFEVREIAARMMHPRAVSVLQKLPAVLSWATVDIGEALSVGRGLVGPHPCTPEGDAAFSALPTTPAGGALLRARPYGDFVVTGLQPETWHRFRVRYGNSRGWGPWTKPSSPACVYPDWPNVVDVPPDMVADSPFSIYLAWNEPDGNGSQVACTWVW